MDALPCSDDGTLTPEHPLYKCIDLMRIATIKAGCPFQDHGDLEIAMKNAGFVDVTVETFKWPQNGWPKDRKLKEGAVELLEFEKRDRGLLLGSVHEGAEVED
jgi:hypothetical protein